MKRHRPDLAAKLYARAEQPQVMAALNVTVFVDRFGATAVEQQIEYLQLQAFPPFSDCKEGLPLLKQARFGAQATKKGCLRSDENIIALTGCEIDYDAGAHSFEYATEQLSQAGIECFLYTSPSHTEEAPRWRVLLPFSREFAGTTEQMKGYRFEAVRQAEAALGFAIAKESYTFSQAYYFGRVTGAHYTTAHLAGECLDRLFDLHKPLPVTPGRTKTVNGLVIGESVDIKGAINQVLRAEHFHDPMLSLSASYAAKGMREGDIVATLQSFMAASSEQDTERWHGHYADIPRLASSAVERFGPEHQWQMALHELRIVWAASQEIKKGGTLDDADHARLNQAINTIEAEGRKLQCST